MSPSNEEVAAKQPEFAEGAAEAEMVHGLMLMSMNMRVHLSGKHRRAMKFQICWQLSNPTSSVLEKGSPRTLRLLRVCRMRGATSMTASRVVCCVMLIFQTGQDEGGPGATEYV